MAASFPDPNSRGNLEHHVLTSAIRSPEAGYRGGRSPIELNDEDHSGA